MQYVLGEADDEQPGIVLAGSKDGCVRLYGIVHLKPVGLINIPRVLSDDEAPHGVRYMEMFDFSVVPGLPWTLLTVDARSRVRLWSLRVHKFHGLLSDLKLIVDGDQPLPLRLDVFTGKPLCVAEPGEAEQEEARRKKEAEKEAAEKEARRAAALAAAAKKGRFAADAEIETNEPSKPSINDLPPAHSKDPHVTAMCVVKETMALPTFERFRWIDDTLKRRWEQMLKDLDAADEDVSSTFLTNVQGKEKHETKQHEESSDEDADPPDVVQARLELRPRTPPFQLEGEAPPPFTYTEGSRFMFLADAGGWIRCVDVQASATTARELLTPMSVQIDDPVVSFTAEAERLKQAQKKDEGGDGASSAHELAQENAAEADANGGLQIRKYGSIRLQVGENKSVRRSTKPMLETLSVGPIFPAKPECWRVVGAWRASEEPVVSLVTTTSPPGLVSADVSKAVKVWSTAGELWAHFSLRVEDGIPVQPTLWPPPHTLAAQLALMEMAQGLTERLGMVTKKPTCIGGGKEEEKEAKKRLVKKIPSDEKDIADLRPWARTHAGAFFRPGSNSQEDRHVQCGMDTPDALGAAEAMANDVKPVRKAMTQTIKNHMSEMVRSGAFSSGYTSYKAFHNEKKKNSSTEARRPMPRGLPTLKAMDMKRDAFHDRRPSGFGVKLMTPMDQEHWQLSTRGLGTRSSSDGALIRFTDHAVTNMARTVYTDLGVDVRTTNRATIRRPSFAEHLDISGVSPDPSLPTSATGQAVQRLLNTTAPPDIFATASSADDGENKKKMTPLQRAGKKMASRR
jgi:hypothetical protein